MEPSRIDRLTALRNAQESVLADGVPARELAALSREYRATLAELAELTPVEQKGDAVDEIARRRTARRSSPAPRAGRAKRTS